MQTGRPSYGAPCTDRRGRGCCCRGPRQRFLGGHPQALDVAALPWLPRQDRARSRSSAMPLARRLKTKPSWPRNSRGDLPSAATASIARRRSTAASTGSTRKAVTSSSGSPRNWLPRRSRRSSWPRARRGRPARSSAPPDVVPRKASYNNASPLHSPSAPVRTREHVRCTRSYDGRSGTQRSGRERTETLVGAAICLSSPDAGRKCRPGKAEPAAMNDLLVHARVIANGGWKRMRGFTCS